MLFFTMKKYGFFILLLQYISNKLYLINTITGSNNFDSLSAFTQLYLCMYLCFSVNPIPQYFLYSSIRNNRGQLSGYWIRPRSWI